MSERAINGFMGVSMEKIRSMVDSNTMVGDPITCGDGVVVIPVSKIAVGFASGGSDLPTRTSKEFFAGGAGAGMSVKPVGFLVVQDGNVKMINIAEKQDSASALIGMIPDVIDKVSALVKKDKKGEETEKDEESAAEEKPSRKSRNPFRKKKVSEADAEKTAVSEESVSAEEESAE